MIKKKRKSIILVSIIIALIACILIGFSYLKKISNVEEPVIDVEPIEPIEENNEEISDKQIWLTNKAINKDYIGEIVFDSGLINKSFVQAKDVYDSQGNLYHFYNQNGTLVTNPEGYTGNDVYIWTDWTTMTYDYDTKGGSVFMDYRSEISDQNVIVYGHHFSVKNGHDPERIKAFTPLELLLEEENYSKNKTLKVILENEIRKYELACVFVYDMENDFCTENCQYYRTEYNVDYFGDDDPEYNKTYIESINKIKLYDTDCDLSVGDKTLTLQTCISGSDTKFEICVFKLIDTMENQG